MGSKVAKVGIFSSFFSLQQRAAKLEKALSDCIALIEAMASDHGPHAEYLEYLPIRERAMVLKAKTLLGGGNGSWLN